MNSIKKLVAVFLVIMAFGGSSVAALPMSISNVPYFSSDSTADACKGLEQLNGGSCGKGDTTGLSTVDNLISIVVNVLSWVVGVVSIIMIIFSGFRYVTAGGDASKVSGAKSTIIYALVGLVIVALAQVLVYFTLSVSSSAANNTCASNPKIAGSSSQCKSGI